MPDPETLVMCGHMDHLKIFQLEFRMLPEKKELKVEFR